MTEDTKNTARNTPPRGPEPIAVQELRFCVKDGRDIPLPGAGVNGGKDIFKAGTIAGGELVIEYKPWLRHHHLRLYEVTGSSPNVKRTLKSQCMVPESWASWVPADDEAV